jgi:hypothetical protein
MKKNVLRKLLEKRKYEKLYELKPFNKDSEVEVIEVKPKKKAKR